MPKPSYQELRGSWNRTTYNGYSPTTFSSGTPISTSTLVLQPIKSARIGWRRIPYPQKSAPLNYSTSVRKSVSGSQNVEDYRIWTDGSGVSDGFRQSGTSGVEILLDRDNAGSQLINEAVYKAKAKLFDKLRGEGANLANMLGERKQVANTVTSLLKTVAYTARDLRRGNVSSAIRRMGGDPDTARRLRKQDIANQWLSLQYGWKPLLSDVYDLINGLHHREMVGVTVLKAGASAMLVEKSKHSSFQHPITSLPTGIRSSRATAKYMIRVRPNLSIAEPAALGFTNPLTVLWEVTPWSFVVDWALPIGRYLEQLSATHGWYFYDGCITTTYNVGEAGGYSWSSVQSFPGYYIQVKRFSAEGGAGNFFEMTRNAISDFPIPDVPQFKNPFSAQHALNGIALLSQAFGRGKVWR